MEAFQEEGTTCSLKSRLHNLPSGPTENYQVTGDQSLGEADSPGQPWRLTSDGPSHTSSYNLSLGPCPLAPSDISDAEGSLGLDHELL